MSIPDPVVLLDARARYVHPAFQMTRASTKTVFDATGRLVTVPANALGWDHDPATGQARGYLAEPSATNLLLHSNDLNQSAWVKSRTTITPAAITGPDGSGMAKLVEDNSAGIHLLRQELTVSDGSTVSASCVGKAGERSQLRMYLLVSDSVGVNCRIDVDLAAGTITNTNAANGAVLEASGIENLGFGFYRMWLAASFGAGVTAVRLESRLSDDRGEQSYEGDGTSGLYLGYYQAEEGSYPTSYIETGAATATRANDGLVCSTSSLPWRNSRGTVVIDADIGWWLYGAVLFSWGNGIVARTEDSNNRLILTGTSFSGTRFLATSLGKLRLAITWDEDEVNAATNGSLIAAPLSITTPPSSNTIGVGSRFSGADSWTGPVHRAVYYPARLSNADLQSLTALQE